jgi:hypothetical protein
LGGARSQFGHWKEGNILPPSEIKVQIVDEILTVEKALLNKSRINK